MDDETGYTVPMAWSEPVTATPLTDLIALEALFRAPKSSIPADGPWAWLCGGPMYPSLMARLRKRDD